MKLGYPNLELLDYKTREYLKEIDPERYRRPDLIADMFAQSWSSTALGFPGIGGSAITTAYTTIFRDLLRGVAVVYFDDSLAYIIENLETIDPEYKQNFIDDANKRRMESVMKASERYGKVLTNYVE